MKKILSLLLSILLIGQSAGIVFATGAEYEVSADVAAFAYGTADGNDVSLAVDGDAGTTWTSLNNTVLRDYLILDMDTAYSISRITVNMPDGVAQNFTVYGANTAKFTDKTALTGTNDGLATDEDVDLGTILSGEAFRYIIFEQDAAETSFGFNEIKVYSTDEVAAEHEGPGSVQLVSFEKEIVTGKNILNSGHDGYSSERNPVKPIVDADPTTSYIKYGQSTDGENAGVMYMVDLGTARTLKQIAWQHASSDSSTQRDNIKSFKIVGSNSTPCSTVKDGQGNPTYDVLVSFDNASELYTAESMFDTGLLVFDVAEAYASTAYRYIGVLKTEGTLNGSTQIRTGTSTLQAYVGIPKPPVLENAAVSKAAVSYTAVAGSSPAFAVDNNPATAWTSNGTGTVRDSLVIDLGAEFSVYAIDILPKTSASAQNISVFGATKSDMTDKVELVAKTNVTETDEATRYETVLTSCRYIVVEQEANAENVLSLAEVGVMVSKKALSTTVANSEPISIISRGKTVQASGIRPSVSSTNGGFATPATGIDDDPSTGTSVAKNSAESKGAHFMADMGRKVKASHIVYQAIVSAHDGTLSSSSQGAANFKVVGTNDSTYATENLKVLGTAGVPVASTDGNTGIYMFQITDDTPYQYYGILSEVICADRYRLNVNTFQVYATSDNLIDYVKEQGVDKVDVQETSEVSADKVSYTTTFLNGEDSGFVRGIFTQYDENGNALQTKYADGGSLIPGAYNELTLSADVTDGTQGRWELIILKDLEIYDYFTDLANKVKAAAYVGGATGDAVATRVGNSMQVAGSVKAGFVGMLVLKPGAEIATFAASDIASHVLAKAPENATNAWDYSLFYRMPADAPGTPLVDNYTLCLFSDSGALQGESFLLPVFNVTGIVSDFTNPSLSAETVVATICDNGENEAFFGSDVMTDIKAATKFGESFMLAKEGLLTGAFDGVEASWDDIGTITTAVQAALVIDATLTEDKIAETIAKYGISMPEVFNEDYNGAEFEEILPSVMDSMEPTDIAGYVDAYKRAVALCLIANGKSADFVKALTTYAAELGIAPQTMETSYSPLKLSSKLSSKMSVVKEKYVVGMDDVIKDIISDLEKEDKQGSQNETLGSSSSNKGSSPSFVSSSRTPASAPQATVTPEGTEAPNVEPVTNGAFTDIANHGWAQDAINLLAEREILSGVGDGTFNPDGVLTREQAVKLLILTLDLTIDPSHNNSQADNGYKDCEFGSWYYPYITYAKVNNLVNGVGKGEFGIGQQVTRQDLAVMLYRALKSRGKLSDETVEFADSDAVSDYAQMAVASLGGMGLITGFPDGSFGPKETTTRAQAAVIFARFLELIEYVAEEAAE